MNSLPISKEELSHLYNSGKSMWEIAQLYGCSPHKIVYWMNKYDLKRRSRSDAIYVKLNPNGDPFLIKNILTVEDTFLYGLGIGIYWGEGEKISRNAVRVANSDPAVIRMFIKFLKDICSVREEKMRFSIVCFNDTNSDEAGRYWTKALKLNKIEFGKIVSIPSQGKGIYKRKSKFGVCTITVSNTKLKKWIMNEIEKLNMPT